MKNQIPSEVAELAAELAKAGYSAYLVGGCVRDTILKREPKDWDIATNATPAQIQKLFPESVYENEFGTVGIKTGSEEPKLKIVEVTTFRTESGYSDKRHPDEVKFAKTVEEDLARRDFTMNAIAMDMAGDIVDPYGGQADIEAGIIRTVGEPEERFGEDALRLMRAVRFATELDFEIEAATKKAIHKLAPLLKDIATERVRDELVKMIAAPRAAEGIMLLEESGLLKYILPELQDGVGVGQNLHHIYTVFEHNVRALKYTVEQDYSPVVRMAALLHDIGKPKTKKGDGLHSTFYGHEVVGARMAVKALERLHFPKEFIEQVAHLVRRHMFYYNVGDVSPAGVRRFVARVGAENIDDLLKVREADRIGSGTPKAVPYKLRHLLFMIEKVKRDPISPKMLAINGEDIMRLTNEGPSRKIGQVLGALLEEVLDDPEKNKKEYLEARAVDLGNLPEKELEELFRKARDRKDELEGEAEEDMKKKHHVQ
jgi:poly(A) polymerase/tRNA nucleotidyltransferase (CCA-adding enzyme)